MRQQPTWILVANSSQAKLFKLVHFPKIEAFMTFSHPESRLHDQDLTSDRPGRAFDSVGVGRHAYEEKHDPKSVVIEKFGRILADYLKEAHAKGEFTRLYVIANPSFMGVLRQEMCSKVKECILSEIGKDMTSFTTADIEEHILATTA